MGEVDVIGLVVLGPIGLEGLRGFDQGGDVLPLRRDDDHNHQRAGNQSHFVGPLVLHERNLG